MISAALSVAVFGFQTALRSEVDVQTIIENSVAANKADWNADPNYSYKERDRIGTITKTYQVTMIDGSPYRRLIAVNNEPLPMDQNVQEERKLQQVIAQRKAESADQRAKRIAKYQAERKRDHLMMDQLTRAFDFKLLGEKKLGSYDVYVLRATPRNGYKPPNMEAQVLPGMRGELWIDQKSFQWVKVTAQVIHPVSIEGFLARVEPGTRFELEKMPVDNGIWLAKHFSMKSSAKILYMFNRSEQEDNTFFDYRKLPATSPPSTPASAPGSRSK